MTSRGASGTIRQFHAEVVTSRAAKVWQLWTTPTMWGAWDDGLREASLNGPFIVGAQGTVTSHGGRVSTFFVTTVDEGRRCVYEVPLVGARLVLDRTIEGSVPSRVRHSVAFVGPLAWVWALVLGRGFRRQLGPTMDALLTCAGPVPGA